jgi:hypothetical protein
MNGIRSGNVFLFREVVVFHADTVCDLSLERMVHGIVRLPSQPPIYLTTTPDPRVF